MIQLLMARIDEIKEILTSLRVGFTVIIGLLVVVVGVLINKEKASDIDVYFWIGLIFVLLLSAGLIYVVKFIIRAPLKTLCGLSITEKFSIKAVASFRSHSYGWK